MTNSQWLIFLTSVFSNCWFSSNNCSPSFLKGPVWPDLEIKSLISKSKSESLSAWRYLNAESDYRHFASRACKSTRVTMKDTSSLGTGPNSDTGPCPTSLWSQPSLHLWELPWQELNLGLSSSLVFHAEFCYSTMGEMLSGFVVLWLIS